MRDDLFFIPMIARVLEERDPRRALRDVLARIQAMGREARYRRGHEQFLRFMDAARATPGGELSAEAWARVLEETDRPLSCGIELETDGVPVAGYVLKPGGETWSVAGIRPGRYRLKLETGLVLWEGRLAERDLVWSQAFPGQALRLAADTEESAQRPTREVGLLEGAVVLRVFAGVEAGTMEIEFEGRGTNGP